MRVKYQVIFSFDLVRETWDKVGHCRPDMVKPPLFQLTEDDAQIEDKEFFKNHRKYVAELTAEQLKEFLDELDVTGYNETLGALTYRGMLPAIDFICEYTHSAYYSCYVSPFIEDNQFPDFTPDDKVIQKYWYQYEKQLMNGLRNYHDEYYDHEGEYEFPDTFEFNFYQLELAI